MPIRTNAIFFFYEIDFNFKDMFLGPLWFGPSAGFRIKILNIIEGSVKWYYMKAKIIGRYEVTMVNKNVDAVSSFVVKPNKGKKKRVSWLSTYFPF